MPDQDPAGAATGGAGRREGPRGTPASGVGGHGDPGPRPLETAWPAAELRGNTAGEVTSSFPAVRTTAVRIPCWGTNSGDHSRIIEVEIHAR